MRLRVALLVILFCASGLATSDRVYDGFVRKVVEQAYRGHLKPSYPMRKSQYFDKRAIPELMRLLRTVDSPIVLDWIIFQLWCLEAKESIRPSIEAMGRVYPNSFGADERSLGGPGVWRWQAAGPLIDGLNSPHAGVRYGCARTLKGFYRNGIKGPSVTKAMVKLSRSADPTLQRIGTEAILDISIYFRYSRGDGEASATLNDFDVFATALKAGIFGYEETGRAVTREICHFVSTHVNENNDFYPRSITPENLNSKGEQLLKAFSSRAPEVRMATAYLFCVDADIRSLLVAIADPDRRVRQIALWGLARNLDTKLYSRNTLISSNGDQIEDLFQHKNPEIRSLVCQVLGFVHEADALPLLKKLFSDPNASVVRAAKLAYRRIEHPLGEAL